MQSRSINVVSKMSKAVVLIHSDTVVLRDTLATQCLRAVNKVLICDVLMLLYIPKCIIAINKSSINFFIQTTIDFACADI